MKMMDQKIELMNLMNLLKQLKTSNLLLTTFLKKLKCNTKYRSAEFFPALSKR